MAIRWSYNKREAFANRHGRRCANCGKASLVSRREAKDNTSITYHIDHIIPQASGGTDEEENLQLLCAFCNTSKNAKDSVSFAEHYDYRLEVSRMKTELAEVTDLDEEYIDRMLRTFSVKDRYHVLSKLLSA